VDAIAASLPELPDDKKARFISELGLSPYDASVLVSEGENADFFEAAAKGRDAKATANMVIGSVFAGLNKAGLAIAKSPVSAEQVGQLVDLQSQDVVSSRIAKEVFELMFEAGPDQGKDPARIVEEKGLTQVTDTGAIEAAVDEVINANPDKVEQAQARPKMAGWFVGQVMQSTGGKANPQAVNKLVLQKLGLEE
jgi:aspartyl-tRNA(Asn)/glutamyl-tRNA(Gln) amidotransferase subunit B